MTAIFAWFVMAWGTLMLVLWVPVRLANDMSRRGRHGWTYAALYLLLPPIGLAAWLVDRRRFRLAQQAS